MSLLPGFPDPRRAFLDGPPPGASTVPTVGNDYLVVVELADPETFDPFSDPRPAVQALDGDDTLVGDGGIGDGGPGDDVLIGSMAPPDPDLGIPIRIGGTGNDTLYSGAEVTVLEGGPGDDVYHVFATEDDYPVIIVDRPNRGFDPAPGDAGLDTVFLYGDVGMFEVEFVETFIAVPGTGNSIIWTGDRFAQTGFGQVVIGNEGRNVLVGLGGADTLTGGGGADFFVLGDGSGDWVEGTAPTITDFDARDRLLIDDLLLPDAAGSRRIDVRAMSEDRARALVQDGLAAYDRATGTVQLDLDGDGALEVLTQLTPGTALGWDDLYLF